jgi:ATPase subunit of ABC transporter with duplicated ATPase domains
LELDNGHGVPWQGNYTSWLEQKLAKMAAKQKTGSTRSKSLARELSWIRMSRGDQREMAQARIREYEQLVAREAATSRGDASTIRIAPGPDLGSQVIEFADVAHQFDGVQVFGETTFAVPRSAVVGLVGPNGTGKTTMMRMVVEQLKPTSGTVTIGSTVKLAYVDQERDGLEGDHGLVQEIGGGADEIILGDRTIPVRQYLSLFGFRGSDQQKSANQLSGGERNRCHLAKVLKVGGNVLLLDEPTNDLDVHTMRLLEEAILDFPGCVLVISHDRFFLNRVCTHLIVFEGEGKVLWFEGNYEDYAEHRRKEFGGELFANRRQRYRRIATA